jgi:hypothetical protein
MLQITSASLFWVSPSNCGVNSQLRTELAGRTQWKSQGRWHISTELLEVENQTTRSQLSETSDGLFWDWTPSSSEETGACEPEFWYIALAQHKYQCHVLITLTRFFLEYKLQDYSKNFCASCLSFCLYIYPARQTQGSGSQLGYCLSTFKWFRWDPTSSLCETHFEIIHMPTRNFLLFMRHLRLAVVCS